VRDEARKDMAINRLQDKLFGKITIRDQEITDFYNANQQQFVDPRGVYLSDIVVDPRDSGGMFKDDAKSDAEATAKIQRIYAQLKGGADFADVARASSEDQSGVRGGDIGMATEPMRFPNGSWYIFKLTNRQLENKPLKLEDPGVKDKIKEALISQRQEILQVALIRNAMSDATVVNKLAESMLGDPNMLGGNQSVTPGASPAASPASSASPAASPSASPAATASPAASATPAPSTAASPAAAPKGVAPKGAAPKGQPSR
jgi:hypothetical protein